MACAQRSACRTISACAEPLVSVTGRRAEVENVIRNEAFCVKKNVFVILNK